ncbi:MAG: ribonuclease H-like domain-containing protein [Deferrisomatales bacterium]|nr:ribonuclease H-like domain-containing protein [Deferrisomatales bacterium]
MSSLRQRLERLERTPRKAPQRQSPVGPELRRRLDRILGTGIAATVDARAATVAPAASRPAGPPDLTRWLDAERVGVGDSSALQVVWEFPPDHRHGKVTVGEIAASIGAGARGLFPEHLGGFEHLHQLAFLDTETTGLAGGAGTIPFQIGVGRWHLDPERGFRVVQLFLEAPHREAALLQLLTRELEGVRCLVTYNGVGYDVPLLQNRHVLTRQPWPLGTATHLDLLPPARALWRTTHPDCRLGTLEASLLGFGRRGDVPGADIPPLYRAYLAGQADPRLAAVFRHNRDDILSLAGLLAAAGEAARCPRGAAALGVGLLQGRRGHGTLARPALEAALRAELPPPQRARALRELSLTHKRAGAWQEALVRWGEMQALDPADPFPVVEAAKALEHRLDDPAAALSLVEQALARGRWIPKDREALERRQRRLLRRAGTG